MSKFRRFRVPIALGMALALAAAACGGDDDDDEGGGNGGGDGGDSISVSGSSTVEPITALAGELFAEENPGVSVRVDGPGTSDGFELFCSGETDISDASRPISEEEIANCEAAGVEYVELEVAIDGLSVITSPNNDAVTCLTFADLYALLGPESGGNSTNWQDAQPLAEELGSTTEFPDAELSVTAPGEESGTWGSFIEIALAGPAEERVAAGAITEDEAETTLTNYQSSGNDNTIVDGIAGADASLGWVGFAFAQENSDRVKTLEIDGGEGCVAPTVETVADGSYPISRSLYIYVDTGKAASNSAIGDFVDFYLGDLASLAEEGGYIPLPEDRIQATTDAWTEAAGG